ncbi:MAG: hypothetical protein U0974_13250 [Gemmatimonadales bacterium]|nr:hypothetical protein [Gemmatimonadales bacterium]
MTSSILIFAAVSAVLTLLSGVAYRLWWNRYRSDDLTPTGFGALLAVVLLMAALIFQGPGPETTALGLVLAAGAVYWIDDFRELSARLRMIVSFVTGAATCVVLMSHSAPPLVSVIGFAVLAGGLNVVLTNIVNFYDGADLNLATLIALTAGMILLVAPTPGFMTHSAVACLAFITPFALMNSRPRTLYLGDAGSFVFASFVTMMALIYFRGDGELNASAAIPLALPALDTFYVFCVRIIKGHDLLTRNYLHLYQKLNHRYRGFGYLVPQIVNVGLVYVAVAALRASGISDSWASILAMAGVTIPVYFACRRLFVYGMTDESGAP